MRVYIYDACIIPPLVRAYTQGNFVLQAHIKYVGGLDCRYSGYSSRKQSSISSYEYSSFDRKYKGHYT